MRKLPDGGGMKSVDRVVDKSRNVRIKESEEVVFLPLTDDTTA